MMHAGIPAKETMTAFDPQAIGLIPMVIETSAGEV